MSVPVQAPPQRCGATSSNQTNICKFDFPGVFAGGQKFVKNNVNVCTTGVFSFTC